MGCGGFLFDCDFKRRVSANLETFERRAYPRSCLKAAAVAVTLPRRRRAASVLRAHAPRGDDAFAQPPVGASRRTARPGRDRNAGRASRAHRKRSVSSRCRPRARPARRLSDAFRLRDHAGGRLGAARSTLKPNPAEVAEVYRVPLAELEHPEVPQLRRIPESPRQVISIPLMGTNVHAPTAAVLYQLREVAIWGRKHARRSFRAAASSPGADARLGLARDDLLARLWHEPSDALARSPDASPFRCSSAVEAYQPSDANDAAARDRIAPSCARTTTASSARC